MTPSWSALPAQAMEQASVRFSSTQAWSMSSRRFCMRPPWRSLSARGTLSEKLLASKEAAAAEADRQRAVLHADPSGAVKAIDRQVTSFEMPGANIEGFAAHAASIAAAGIYDFRVHYEQVLVPVVINHWRLESVEGLDDGAEAAREHLLGWMARLRRVAEGIAAQSPATPRGPGRE